MVARPSGSKYFGFHMQLHFTITAPKVRSLIYKNPSHEQQKIGILEPLHENEKEVDGKCGNLKENITKTNFTKELKASFTRAAFQHWKRAVEATSIEDTIPQSKIAATINKTAIQTQAKKMQPFSQANTKYYSRKPLSNNGKLQPKLKRSKTTTK